MSLRVVNALGEAVAHHSAPLLFSSASACFAHVRLLLSFILDSQLASHPP